MNTTLNEVVAERPDPNDESFDPNFAPHALAASLATDSTKAKLGRITSSAALLSLKLSDEHGEEILKLEQGADDTVIVTRNLAGNSKVNDLERVTINKTATNEEVLQLLGLEKAN